MTDTHPLDPILVAAVEHAVATYPERLEALAAESGLAWVPPPGLREPAAQALVLLMAEEVLDMLDEMPGVEPEQLEQRNFAAGLLARVQRSVAGMLEAQAEAGPGPWPSPAHAVLAVALATVGEV